MSPAQRFLVRPRNGGIMIRLRLRTHEKEHYFTGSEVPQLRDKPYVVLWNPAAPDSVRLPGRRISLARVVPSQLEVSI